MFLSHIDNFAVEKKYLAPRIQVVLLEFLRKRIGVQKLMVNM